MSDPVGPAAEEAGRLFAAMEAWVRNRAGDRFDAEHLATGGPACSVCPLCQGVNALRALRPDTVEHLVDAAASLLAAVRAAVGPAGGTWTGAPAGASPHPGAAPEGAPLQHIDVQEG